MGHQADYMPYILITPSRNEAKFIETTIQSVIKQTVLPSKWVIVNDGSTDETASIVDRYAAKYSWIELINLPARKERNFAAKVHAFKAGQERVKNIEYEVIGNLDADVSLDEDHFEFLLGKFREDSHLGVAGTVFREKSFYHHRVLGTAERGVLASSFAYGKKDYILGGHPLWELFRCAYRMTKRPYLVGGMALFAGYLAALLSRTERPVSDELMGFHRREQMVKLKAILVSICKFRRIDSFELMPIEQPSSPVVHTK